MRIFKLKEMFFFVCHGPDETEPSIWLRRTETQDTDVSKVGRFGRFGRVEQRAH